MYAQFGAKLFLCLRKRKVRSVAVPRPEKNPVDLRTSTLFFFVLTLVLVMTLLFSRDTRWRAHVSSAKNLSRATEILQRLTGMPPPAGTSASAPSTTSAGSGFGAMGAPAAPADATTPEARKRVYVRSSVRVLRRNTPQLSVAIPVSPQSSGGGGDGDGDGSGGRWRSKLPPAPLADVSVRQLLKELSDIVDPPRKLPRFKVHLRRAPTQEVRE